MNGTMRAGSLRGLVYVFFLALFGCGGGGGDGGSSSDQPSPPAPPPPEPSPAISVSPSSLSFGDVTVGDAATLTFTVENTGGGTLSGSVSGLSDTFMCTSGCTYSLGGGNSQTVAIRFAPTSAGLANGMAAFSGAGGSSKPVSGTGISVPPPPPPPEPVSVTFSAAPSIVNWNDTAMLSWSATGADSCVGNGPGFSGPIPISGSQATAKLTNKTMFGITCTGPGGTDSKSVSVSVNPPVISLDTCTVTSTPLRSDIDPLYTQFCGDELLHARALGHVSDVALQLVNLQARMMMPDRDPAVLLELLNNKPDVEVIAPDECILDLPELSQGGSDYPPGRNCENMRGIGGSITVTSEENVLCDYVDPSLNNFYVILIHERAHTIHLSGIAPVHPEFNQVLEQTYQNAKAKGLWSAQANDYAMTNKEEYWAEGVTAYYNARNPHLVPLIPGYIGTRATLANGDQDLFQLIEKYLPAVDIPICPSQ